MHPTAKSYTKWGKTHIMDELRTKEEAENDKKVHESLNNFIRQAMGQEPYASLTKLPGWPLLSPSKVQMQKCEKCSLEFCSPNNHRRHIRMHRRSLAADNEDFRKERPNIATFWRKLSPEEASQIFSLKNFKLENLSGTAAVKALSSLVKQPGFSAFPQLYIKAGAALLDILQNKIPVHTMTADELFSIMDNASEQTFLCGGTSVAVQRFVYHGDSAKQGLDERNVVATVAFLLEHKLVKAWMVDKDAEALRFQKELVEEEELIQRRKQRILERKRQRKLRQKGSKEKERKEIGAQLGIKIVEGSSPDYEENSLKFADDCDSPACTASSSLSSASIGKNEKHVESTIGQLADDCDDSSTKDEADSLRGTKDEFEFLRETQETTFQSARKLSFDNGQGSSLDIDLSRVDKDSAVIESAIDLSTDPNKGEVNIEAGMLEPFVSPTGNFKAEIVDMDGELHNQVQDRERTARIQRRPSGVWKGNEHESYSMHSRNYELEKPYSHRKNGRLAWDGRSAAPFEKAWITKETMNNEDRLRNLVSRQFNRPYRSHTNFTDSIKAEQRLSSDFEFASGPKFQQYRHKFLRTKQASPSTANGYAVWTRKADVPASILDVHDNTEEHSSNISCTFHEASEDALPSLEKSDAVPQSNELSENDYPENLKSRTSMPGALEIFQPGVSLSPDLRQMEDADGTESKRVKESYDVFHSHDTACLRSPIADPCSQSPHWHAEDDPGNALIIGSLCVPLGNGGSSLFQTVPVVNARTSEFLAEVDAEVSVQDLEVKSNVDMAAKVLKLDEDEAGYTNLAINSNEKLAKQASIGASVGRSGTGKVWRARGSVGNKSGVGAFASMADHTCIESDSNSYRRGNFGHDDGCIDDEDKSQGDPNEFTVRTFTSENLSYGSMFEQSNGMHLNCKDIGGDTNTTDGEIVEPVARAMVEQNTIKNTWGYSSVVPSATAFSFLLHRWDAAISEVSDTLYS